MKILSTTLIFFSSILLASSGVIKYEHNLEFIKYEVNDKGESNEEDHLTVKIYTIEAMETKFNKLAEELSKQQQNVFDDHKVISEKALKQFHDVMQEIDENLIQINKSAKLNLEKFESFKKEITAKKENLTEEYMKEILTYQNDLNVKEQICKNSIEQLNKEKIFLTNILDGCMQCSQDRIGNLKREIQATEKSLKMENDYCEESAKFLRDKISEIKSNMTDQLLSLQETQIQEFLKIIAKFYEVSKLEKLLHDSATSKSQYLSKKEKNDSKMQSRLENLNKMLIFDSIKPKSGEVIYSTNNEELESENFLQNFLTKTNGKEYNQQLSVSQTLNVEEPSFISWEKIHEKTTLIPENSVIAGYDVDGATLYVVRACESNKCTYGKYARSSYRQNAYIPFENEEKGVEEVEVNQH